MFDDLNDPCPPPADLAQIASRARVLRRRRTGALAISGVAMLAAGSVLALQVDGGHRESLTTGDPKQVANQPCLSSSLSMSAVWSSEAQTYYQPTASPPAEEHGTESQGYVQFTNTADVSCSLEGAPALAILDQGGQPAITSTAVRCEPGPCTWPGDVELPDGNPGRLLAPGDSAGSVFEWGASYCGAAPGSPARLTVTVSGGNPVTVDLVDRDPSHPGTAPTCDHRIPIAGVLESEGYRGAPKPLAVPSAGPS